MKRHRPRPDDRRRSHRMPCAVPVLLQSLDPDVTFAARGVMLEVSAHGCVVRAPRPFMSGVRLNLQLFSSRRLAAARVVRSIPADADVWNVGIEFDGPSRLIGALCSPRRRNGQTGQAPVLQAVFA